MFDDVIMYIIKKFYGYPRKDFLVFNPRFYTLNE